MTNAWDYESNLQASAERAAKSLFSAFNVSFSPRVFIVRLLLSHRADQHVISIEPVSSLVASQNLTKLQSLHESMGRLVVSNLYVEERSLLSSQYDKLRSVLLGELEALNSAQAYKYFCSQPSTKNEHLVFVVLQLDKKTYNSRPRLQKEFTAAGEPLEVSLLDAAVTEFLLECQRLINSSDPLSQEIVFRGTSEILRAAGHRLMRTPERLLGSNQGDLFQTCATIASLKYEGQEGNGRLFIANSKHPSLDVKISFLEPVDLHSFRAVRKLLQLASPDLSLITDSKKIIGLGSRKDNYERDREDLLAIRFVRHHVWELRHFGTVLMRVSYGEPRLAKNRFDVLKFRASLIQVFQDISDESLETLSNIMLRASINRRGALLIISVDAKAESERLKRHCTRIVPTRLSPEAIDTVSAIDGAVIFDTKGYCHAFGAILDGTASRFGTAARGSRFNSALRYVDSRQSYCFAVVFSEDRTVDFVPDLMPEEGRSLIEGNLANLREIFSKGTSLQEMKTFYEIMDWFDSNRKYLEEKVCQELNQLQEKFQKMLPPDKFKIVYPEFVPDGLMH